jgi:hypothetical protein
MPPFARLRSRMPGLVGRARATGSTTVRRNRFVPERAIEVDQRFYNPNAPAQQRLLNLDKLLQMVHIRHGRRFDVEKVQPVFNVPTDEFEADAGQFSAPFRFVNESAPVRANNQTITRCESSGNAAEGGYGDHRPDVMPSSLISQAGPMHCDRGPDGPVTLVIQQCYPGEKTEGS